MDDRLERGTVFTARTTAATFRIRPVHCSNTKVLVEQRAEHSAHPEEDVHLTSSNAIVALRRTGVNRSASGGATPTSGLRPRLGHSLHEPPA